jgi:hypothetical protein
VPAFVAFCFVSGKQPHYLLPLLPALALYLAKVLGAEGAHVRGRLFGVLLLIAGVALAAFPYVAAHAQDFAWLARLVAERRLTPEFLHVAAGIWPLWGALAALTGLVLLCLRGVHASLRALALASAAAAALGMLALAQGVGPYVDVRVAAARIRQDQDTGRPIAHLAWHHGLFEFPGRFTQPLPKVNFDELRAWCAAHPDGEIVTFYTKYPIPAKPDLQLPYRFGFIRFWRAQDLLAMPWPEQAPAPDADETPDD